MIERVSRLCVVSKSLIFAALRAEFAVRIEDLGVLLLRWAFNVQMWHGHLARVHGGDAHATSHLLPLTSYLLLTSACRYSLFTLSLPPLAIFDSLSIDAATMCGAVH